MEKDSPAKPSVAELAGRFKGHVIPTPTAHDEKDSPAKPSVAELAGRFKGHVIPTPTAHDENPSIASPDLSKVKMKKSKSSPLIEKLQANLTLSPTSLLPSPKSPEVKLAPMPISPTTLCFSPTSPCSPLSATLRPQLSSEEEEPVSFERPAEGTPLPSFNKNRVRLSFKRRPSTRQHRKSYVEEGIVSEGGCVSKGDPDGPQFNGAEEQVFEQPDEGGQGAGVTRGSPPSHPDTLTETGDNDRDSEEDKVLEEETGESAPPTQDVEEEAGKEEAGEQALGETQASDSLEAVEEVGSCSSFGTIGDNNQTEEQEDPPQTQERDENL